MKRLLLLFLCLYISWTGTAQNITTQISVNIKKREPIEEDKRPHLFDGECEQLLLLQNMTSDTIILSLENTDPWGRLIPAYTFPKLQVFVKSLQDVEYQEIDFSFGGQQLVFAIPEPNCQVKIAYFFCPFSTFFNGAVYLLVYKYDSESWFFTCPDMRIEAVTVTEPNNLYFFSNLPEVFQDVQTIGNRKFFIKFFE